MAASPPVPTYAVQSVDLALTRYAGVPSAAPLPAADSWGALDLQVRPTGSSRAATLDLGSIAGRQNLAQALMLRLLTPQGALEPLGHPAYGSRLTALIGQENNQATRNLARLYVIEAVRQEPRVRALTALAVTPTPGQPGMLSIALTVTPLNDADPLALTLDVAL